MIVKSEALDNSVMITADSIEEQPIEPLDVSIEEKPKK